MTGHFSSPYIKESVCFYLWYLVFYWWERVFSTNGKNDNILVFIDGNVTWYICAIVPILVDNFNKRNSFFQCCKHYRVFHKCLLRLGEKNVQHENKYLILALNTKHNERKKTEQNRIWVRNNRKIVVTVMVIGNVFWILGMCQVTVC